MKKRKNRVLWITVLASLTGTLFAGYLTLSEFLTQKCFFGEACPEFLGYPACTIGLALFAIIFTLSLKILFSKKKINSKRYLNALLLFSIAGLLFSGYFSMVEIIFPYCGKNFCKYKLFLPTCVYGFITFIITFASILTARKNH